MYHFNTISCSPVPIYSCLQGWTQWTVFLKSFFYPFCFRSQLFHNKTCSKNVLCITNSKQFNFSIYYFAYFHLFHSARIFGGNSHIIFVASPNTESYNLVES